MRHGQHIRHTRHRKPLIVRLARQAGVLLLAMCFAGQAVLALANCQMFGPIGATGVRGHAGHAYKQPEGCEPPGMAFSMPRHGELAFHAVPVHCPFCSLKTSQPLAKPSRLGLTDFEVSGGNPAGTSQSFPATNIPTPYAPRAPPIHPFA